MGMCGGDDFQVRRGADRAEIYCLAFSPTAQWLAVSSDKGTVHVFNLKVDSGLLGHDRSHGTSEANPSSPTAVSSLSFFKGLSAMSYLRMILCGNLVPCLLIAKELEKQIVAFEVLNCGYGCSHNPSDCKQMRLMQLQLRTWTMF